MKKRGISSIIAVILLVLISISAAIILWNSLKKLFETDFDFSSVTLNLKITSAKGYGEKIEVKVKRNFGKGNIVKMKFVFNNDTESYIESREGIEELEENSFNFSLEGKISDAKKVSIAPVVKTNGKEKVLGVAGTSSIEYEPVVVSLGRNEIVADLSPGEPSEFWAYIDRFNISGLSKVNIQDAKFCVYINAVTGTPANDSRISRINNQTWDETYSSSLEDDLPLTNASDDNLTSITAGTWGCVNVTNIIQTDYAEGNSFTSIYFANLEAVAYMWDKVTDGTTGSVGVNIPQDNANYITINHREADSNQPYLNITYTKS